MAIIKDKIRNTWYVQYRKTKMDGTKIATTKRGFKTKAEAKQWEQLELIGHTDTATITTFEDTLPHFLKEHKKLVSNSTYTETKRNLTTYALPTFKKRNLHSITAKDIRMWQNKMLTYNYTAKTYANYHTQLSAFFNHCMFYFDLKQNPCTVAGGFKLQDTSKNELRFWTLDEFEYFYNSITDLRRKVTFLVLYYSGLRPGELCCLNWSDLKSNYLIITKTTTRIDGKLKVGMYTKTRKNRKVTLPNFVIEQLLEYKKHCKTIFPKFNDNFYMFNDKENFLPPSSLRGWFNQDKPKDLKHIRMHDFRHSHVSYLAHIGVDIELVAKRLGHTDSTVTRKRYLHFYPQDEDKIIDIMEQQHLQRINM